MFTYTYLTNPTCYFPFSRQKQIQQLRWKVDIQRLKKMVGKKEKASKFYKSQEKGRRKSVVSYVV